MKRSRVLMILGGAALASALLLSPAAAKYGSPGGGGPPGGGEEEAGNNLSVPAIFVPSMGLAVGPTCTAGDDTVLPNPAEMSADFPGYWVQGEATWQADCMTAAAGAVSVRAEWGDNLTNAPLKQRTPIRVELGLLADATLYPMTGFPVVKLTPELLDRYATYGTNDADGTTPYTEVRVWTSVANLKIVRSDGLVAYDGPFSAEINSTGRVVFGYNWQKPLAGSYTITVTMPDVTVTSVDAGTFTPNQVSLTVDVAQSAGRGGSGGGKPSK